MSLLDTIKASLQEDTTTVKTEKAKSQYWLNIGLNNEAEETFIGLNYGIPLESVEELPLKGKNEKWLQLVEAKNALRKALLDLAGELEPGETKIINLQAEIRRVGDEAVTVADNPLLKHIKF